MVTPAKNPRTSVRRSLVAAKSKATAKPREPEAGSKVTPDTEFAKHCCEMMGAIGPVTAKRMFGGWGLRADGLMVGLIAWGQLFLKIDATTKPQFAAEGGENMVFDGKGGKPITMSYMKAPTEALDAAHLMAPWASLAMQAALRTANAKGAVRRRAR